MTLKVNIAFINKQINLACSKVGRNPREILILAATKTRTTQEINQILKYGITAIGENRVQELNKKLPNLSCQFRLDFIGHLQTNKVKPVIKNCYLIHSLDSLKLAWEINKQARKINKVQNVLLEVNIAKEETKFGFAPKEIEEVLKKCLKINNIKIKGLMTVEPYRKNPEQIRPIFIKLRQIKDKLEKKFKISLPQLSMGMSQSYCVAIEDGATIIRLGTAIFGERSNLL